MIHKELTVIDFFCGAGGFSEGFRQQGFKIIHGIDKWQPAINTHNLNHGLNDGIRSVLDFWSDDTSDVTEIEKLDDTDVIIGSPPCVSFSSSNKSGNADKTLGIALIKAYLRVIAVKKHKPGSQLKVWYMENVPNSQKFTEEKYTFEMLNLSKWAESIGKDPSDLALEVQKKGKVLNSGDYGAPQSRQRFICGEWCKTGEFLEPEKTHENNHVILGDILTKLPKPNLQKEIVLGTQYIDPNYKNLYLEGKMLTDHFYDTGLYKIEWHTARELKINHSYMGKMSFPENMNRPCRTIMATRSAKTRESLIFESEYKRIGDGQYRLPTIREIASLMGFPLSYQFTGSEGSKWRQIGNAVSPHLSSALAKAIKIKMGYKVTTLDFSHLDGLYEKVEERLNTFQQSPLNKPKKRMKDAKFRGHPYKSGNMTVELMNFLEEKKDQKSGKNWYIKLYFGTGEGHRTQIITKKEFREVGGYLEKNIPEFDVFRIDFEEKFATIFGITKKELQKNYEEDGFVTNNRNPLLIVENIGKLILGRREKDTIANIKTIIKNEVPVGQLYIIYCLGKIVS